MTKTYGIISDLHNVDPRLIPITLQILKNEDVNTLVLNGDIIGERSGYNPLDYFANLLDVVGKSGLETYVLPGSHEEVIPFEHVLNQLASQYSNLIDTLKSPKIEFPDHHLLFLPGSDWRSGEAVKHGFSLETEHESGVYQNKNGLIHVTNMADLQKQVTSPEQTIVFSHIPRQFDNVDNCVDMAQFGEVAEDFDLWQVQYTNGEQGEIATYHIFGKELRDKWASKKVAVIKSNNHIPNGSIIPGPEALRILALGENIPIQMKEENRGNASLAQLYDQLGITKNITGHFHESAGRANDSQGRHVEEGLYVNNLFYNASCLDRLMVGLVSVDGHKVAYENIDLRKYIR